MGARRIRSVRSGERPPVVTLLAFAAAASLAALSGAQVRADAFGFEDEKEDRAELLLAVLRAQVEKTDDSPSILGDWDLKEAPVPVQRIARVLRDTTVEVQLDKETVPNVLDLVRSISGLNFVISRKAREAIEQDDPRITMKLKDLRLENFLNLLAVHLGDFRFTIRYGAIVLVHREEYRRRLVSRTYSVRELVRVPPDFPAPKMGLHIPGEDETPLFR